MTLYTPLDLQIEFKYKKTHDVFKKKGTEVDLRNLEDDESVIWGDGETYHYLLKEIKP
jgi:hypothetical protein